MKSNIIIGTMLLSLILCQTAHSRINDVHDKDGNIIAQYINDMDFMDKINEIKRHDALTTRGEFETKDEFKKRMASLNNDVEKNFSIKIIKEYLRFEYDIDTEQYRFNGLSVYDNSLIIGVEEYEENSGYVGESILGAKKIVLAKKKKIYGVKIIDVKHKYQKSYSLSFSFKMKPQEAKALKDTLTIVIECVPVKIDGKFLSYKDSYNSPTVSSPQEETTHSELINARIKNIYIVNKNMNEAVSTIKMQ